MTEENQIDWSKYIDKLFSKDPLTKGEIIQILLVVLLILLIIYISFRTECTIDCSLCEHTGQIIRQRGW